MEKEEIKVKTRFVTDPNFSFVLDQPLPSRLQRWCLRRWFGWKCEPVTRRNMHMADGGIRSVPI